MISGSPWNLAEHGALAVPTCTGLLYMLHKGYCDGAFPMHDEAGANDPGKKEILEMVWSRYDQQDDAADRLLAMTDLHEDNVDGDRDDAADRPWSTRSRGRTSASAFDNGSSDDFRHELDRTWAKSCRFQPLWKIRNYFGEKIALYFAWCGMLSMSLWPPMLFGFAVFLYGLYLRSDCICSCKLSLSMRQTVA